MQTLAKHGWQLAETTNEKHVTLTCLLAVAFYKSDQSLSLSSLTRKVNHCYGNVTMWGETDVAQVATIHPYIEEIERDRYQFRVRWVESSSHIPPEIPPSLSSDNHILSTKPLLTPMQGAITEKGKVLLSKLWAVWLSVLNERYQEVLFLYYGVRGETSLTMKEVGEQMGLTRSRVQQIDKRGLGILGSLEHKTYWLPLHHLLSEGIQEAGGLLTTNKWEHLLDKKTVWEDNEARPIMLKFLCAIFDEFRYLDSYQAATVAHITRRHLNKLEGVVKNILRPQQTGLTVDELMREIQRQFFHPDTPSEVRELTFILNAIELFDRVGPGKDDRYFYLKKKRESLYPTVASGWAGQPGTHLNKWELELRQKFEEIAWIGQLSLTEDDFKVLCQIIQEEAQDTNIHTNRVEGQPRLVPPAVFVTTMVFAARYSEQDADEFWVPYLRNVWNVEYSQAFMSRCRKRFISVVFYLEKTFGFEFPQQSAGDLVRPIYRHALLPRYMQADFAVWLRSKWQDILATADAPELFVTELRQDRSLGYLPQRLQKFILDKATQDTAAALITNMAAAIDLHVNDSETIENIHILLEDTPIEQELWREIAQEFAQQQDSVSSLRLSKPRLTWVWSLDDDELALRVQNIILPAENKLDGEPDRLVWLDTPDADPLMANIEVEVTPWRMITGERIINEVFFQEPDGSLNGQIVLLTDLDEVAIRLDVPSCPADDAQFFRATQQGAYGVPVKHIQVSDGIWFVCTKQPLLFFDKDDEIIKPDIELTVPYPLDEKYTWAAQLTLSLPVTVKQGPKKIAILAQTSSQPAIGRPSLIGTRPVAGLSRQVQPTFSDTQISLRIEYGGKRLLKQVSLWIRGQDGWRCQRPLAELRQQGIAELVGSGLRLDLGKIIPAHPNFYAVELRISLQPIFPAPLQFAIVPDLEMVSPPDDRLHTPANPPQIVLRGVDEATVVRREGLQVDLMPDGCQQITWTDLRQEPHLLLRFDKVDIPLAWSVPRFAAWLEPKPAKPFLTLDEMRQTTLHAVGTRASVESFTLFIPGQHGRSFQLKRGRYSTRIGHSQLYDMVRLVRSQHTLVKAQVGTETWTLLEIRKRPQLPLAQAEYAQQEQMVLFTTGLQENWAGNSRFVAESLTNPFAPIIELGQTAQLDDLHFLPASLPDGVYLFRLELDGDWLLLNEQAVHFTVGETSDDLVHTPQLVREIRQGQLISPHSAEDFVLWWAEIAEAGKTELTPTTLYQLATISAEAFENFTPKHLLKLWSPLAILKEVHDQSRWIEEYGLLPAWILLPQPIILITTGHGSRLRVYPIQTAQGGLSGMGYGRWRISIGDDAPKKQVYVQWGAVSATHVHVEAGLPEKIPNDWTALELLDTYGLYYCSRCGRLTGAVLLTIPNEIKQAHLHGYPEADLRGITFPEESGGHQLMAEFFLDRRGQRLQDIYREYGIVHPNTTSYLPEPRLPEKNLLDQVPKRTQLMMLIREIKRRGSDSGGLPFWASAERLLVAWRDEEEISQLGQAVFALGVLLRTAAYNRSQFQKLRKDASLSELDVQYLLAELNKTAPAHLRWGLVWAELLYLHSPGR